MLASGSQRVVSLELPSWLRQLSALPAHTWFLVLAVPVGLLLLVALPPTQGTDEPNHFYRAYTISSGALVAPLSGGRAGSVVPTCVYDYIIFEFMPAPTNRRFHPSSFLRQPPSCTSNRSTRVFFENTAFNSPLPYLPQAVALTVGRAVGAPVPALFYAGRLAAFVAFLALVYLALRVTPAGQCVLFVLGLWPMTLLLATTYSADTMTIALALLSVACILRVRLDPSAGWGLLALTFAAVAGLALCKNTYYALAPILFLVPVRQVRSPLATLAVRVAALAVVLLLSLAWYLQARNWGMGMAAYFPPGTVDPAAQTRAIIAQPASFLKLMADNLLGGRAGYFTWQTFVAQVGFFRTLEAGSPFPSPPVFVLAYLLLAWAYVRETVPRVTWLVVRPIAEALLPVVLVLINVVAIFTVLFVVATPMGKSAMEVQGRYLLPLVAVPLISLAALSCLRERSLTVLPMLPALLLIHSWLVVKVLTLFYS